MAHLSACAKKLPLWFQPSTYLNETKIALWRQKFISTSSWTIPPKGRSKLHWWPIWRQWWPTPELLCLMCLMSAVASIWLACGSLRTLVGPLAHFCIGGWFSWVFYGVCEGHQWRSRHFSSPTQHALSFEKNRNSLVATVKFFVKSGSLFQKFPGLSKVLLRIINFRRSLRWTERHRYSFHTKKVFLVGYGVLWGSYRVFAISMRSTLSSFTRETTKSNFIRPKRVT